MGRLRLSEKAAIDALLVRAIEGEDAGGLALTAEDRQYATSAALSAAPIGENASRRDTAAFVARRAQLALQRLTSRYPTLDRVRTLSRWPAWFSWGVPALAFVIGISANVLEGARLNILAPPLLAMIAWNIVVYLVSLVRTVGRSIKGRAGQDRPLPHWLEWIVRPAAARLAGQPTLERGVARFGRDWASAAGPLTRARANRTLHFSAAMLALGILAGMLLRARYTAEYSAGWAGTWAGAENEIAVFLKIVLGPASALTGIALPSPEALRQLRGGGENAGNWLILWAVTAGLFVIVPRLILAAMQAARAGMLARSVPVPNDFYLRSLLRNALGRAGIVRVLPYSIDLSEAARERLTRILMRALGDKTRVQVDAPIPYGGEDDWLARDAEGLSDTDQIIVLFNLASTPEAENHGAFVSGVRQKLAKGSTGLAVLLDETSFRHKLRGQGSGERRLSERLDAWKTVVAAAGLTPATIALDADDEDAAARALEGSLQRSMVPA